MRKGLAAGAVLASLFLAGCGGQASPPAESADAPTQSAETSTPKSARTAPAKSLEVADKCSIVTEQQATALGADQAPRARDSNGQAGCTYQKGKAGTTGWGAFVAASEGSTFNAEVESRGEATKKGEVAGYPTAGYDSGRGCVLFADVSDQGYLLVNILRTSTDDPGVDMCQQAEKFAEAAIQNLPNA
ncbi:DUF3558 domain-containing protein [Saccharopolyspora sp. WRP15-2]|uniref:DUF3558 domain-containing protein n=1 Tax=Saccharopolyspora oryzae TaxID=2997343 RepID=A0ABT4V8G1_9PSEU|nr:DUF3558 domain-containing protein [Saccharopolyspora oryzae]MDA3630218.1 DUF3558 domain-containing protein [Saccharopolyspora oryzae]